MQLQSEDVAFLVWCLGCSLSIHIWITLSISLLDLIRSFPLYVPGKRSISCVCSKVTFLCWMVSFTTGLTSWLDRSRSSIISVICIVSVVIVRNLIVGVRVYLTTVVVVVPLAGTIRIGLGLVFLSIEMTVKTISVKTWFFQWWKIGLSFSGFCCVACCVTVFIFSSFGASKPISCNSFSRCDTYVQLCHSTNSPNYSIYSGEEVFWPKKIAGWSPERQFRMEFVLKIDKFLVRRVED